GIALVANVLREKIAKFINRIVDASRNGSSGKGLLERGDDWIDGIRGDNHTSRKGHEMVTSHNTPVPKSSDVLFSTNPDGEDENIDWFFQCDNIFSTIQRFKAYMTYINKLRKI